MGKTLTIHHLFAIDPLGGAAAAATQHDQATKLLPVGVGGPGDLILSLLTIDDLLALRQTCHAAARWVDRVLPRLFSTLRWNATFSIERPELSICVLKTIGIHSQNLVIRVKSVADTAPQREGSSSSSLLSRENSGLQRSSSSIRIWKSQARGLPASDGPQVSSCSRPEYWLQVFQHLPYLTSLSIVCVGASTWGGFLAVERSLVAIRQALESSCLPQLVALRLVPIHAIGILHFRWAGGSAYGNADWFAGTIWRRIKILEMGVLNPAGQLARDQQKVFVKVLHDYLASFSDSVEELSFEWIGATGPNPLFLEETVWRGRRSGRTAFSAPTIKWRTLRIIYLRACSCEVRQVVMLFEEKGLHLTECTILGDVQGPMQAFAGLKKSGIEWSQTRSTDENGVVNALWTFRRLLTPASRRDSEGLGTVRIEGHGEASLVADPVAADEDYDDYEDDDYIFDNNDHVTALDRGTANSEGTHTHSRISPSTAQGGLQIYQSRSCSSLSSLSATSGEIPIIYIPEME